MIVITLTCVIFVITDIVADSEFSWHCSDYDEEYVECIENGCGFCNDTATNESTFCAELECSNDMFPFSYKKGECQSSYLVADHSSATYVCGMGGMLFWWILIFLLFWGVTQNHECLSHYKCCSCCKNVNNKDVMQRLQLYHILIAMYIGGFLIFTTHNDSVETSSMIVLFVTWTDMGHLLVDFYDNPCSPPVCHHLYLHLFYPTHIKYK